MAQIQSSNLYAITAKTIDTRPNEVIALIRRNGVMIPDGASSKTIDKAFASLITKSKAFQQQFAQLATKTVMDGDVAISFDGSVAQDGAFRKSNLSFDGSVAQDGAFKKSNLSFDASVAEDGGFGKSSFSFDGSLARDGAMPMSNFKDVSNEVNFEGTFPMSRFDDVSTEVNFSGAGLGTTSSTPPKAPTPITSTSKPATSSTSGTKKLGLGSYFTPEFVQSLLTTGLGVWAFSKTGQTPQQVQNNLDEGRNDPAYNQNPPAKGLSTTGVVLISLGVITAIGVAVYFMRKK